MVQISKWQLALVCLILLLGFAFAAPNLLPRSTAEGLPDWLPKQQINLGLDLQGGSHVLMEVQFDEAFEEQLANLVDAVRQELRSARIGYTNLGVQGDGVTVELTDPARTEEVRSLLRDLGEGLVLSVEDETRFRLQFSEEAIAERQRNIVNQSIEIVRRRVDETGTREPTIQRQGDDRILIQLPGIGDPARIIDLIGQTAKLSFRFVDENALPGGRVPPTAEVLPSQETDASGQARRYVVSKRVMVSGEQLVDAQATFQEGQPVVSFTFDTAGAKRFADATRDNVGRLFAIVLDDEVISAPVIREPILGGSGVISGNFTVQEAQDLALLLRAGALPAPLTVIEQRAVGPGLGADSVRAGEIAAVVGLAVVLVFMAAAYGGFGMMANIALIVNLILILAALSGLQATLTLPGIAGIVLTLGMAVDANVLIFERMREEIRNGRGPVTAIDAGYRRALNTIIDSNLTTLIAALLLFQFGSGPVRGFAVTLAIGLVTSMFSAIMVTRLMVIFWLRRRRPQALPI